jgi:endonuclease/exonuclease/phosphatase family metal-dependent hydrolase
LAGRKNKDKLNYKMIKILSWNCCLPPWSLTRKKRIPNIVSTILKFSPEIICLQEVFFKKDGEKIIKDLRIKGYSHSFHFKDLLIVSKIRLSHKKGNIFKSQGKLFSLAALDFLYKKGFQSIQFSKGEKSFSLVNTHLLSAWAFSFSQLQKTREEQVKEICNLSWQQSKKRNIILGDFNFQPNTSPYNSLIDSNFIDASKTAGNTLKNIKLDFIFFKNVYKINSKIAFFDKTLSDHAALITSIN